MLRMNMIIFVADSKRRKYLPALAPCVTELVQLTRTSLVIRTNAFGTASVIATTVCRFTTRVISPSTTLSLAFVTVGNTCAATIGIVARASVCIPEAAVVHAHFAPGIAPALCAGLLRVTTSIIFPNAASSKALVSGFVIFAALFDDAFLARAVLYAPRPHTQAITHFINSHAFVVAIPTVSFVGTVHFRE